MRAGVECLSVMPHPATTEAEQSAIAFHDHLSAVWESRYAAGGFARRKHFFVETILPRLSVTGRWVDVGCGSGLFSRMFAERGCEVLGIDGASGMIRVSTDLASRSSAACRMRFQVQDIATMTLGANVDDGAISLSVLEYLNDPHACLAAMAMAVRPGGQVVISVPNRHSAVRRVQSNLKPLARLAGRDPFSYLNASLKTWTASDLTEEARSLGMDVEAIEAFDPVLPRWAFGLLPPSLLFAVFRKPII